ncbi:MAG: ComF family protein [Clostridia bacterium]|nr:ComF family protein [Clostridia bacterium]
MKIKEFFARIFSVRTCFLCDEPISYDDPIPFCDECESSWHDAMDILCSSCGMTAQNCTCLPERVREINHSIAGFAYFYTPSHFTPVNKMVYTLKESRDYDILTFCIRAIHKVAIRLCIKHKLNYKKFVVTYPPRREESIEKYGHDHAKMLAKGLAKELGIGLEEYFYNEGSDAQKSLTKSGRFENAMRSYTLRENIDVKGKNIFLIDDVMTSGATLCACARLLKKAGANQVVPITLARDMRRN